MAHKPKKTATQRLAESKEKAAEKPEAPKPPKADQPSEVPPKQQTPLERYQERVSQRIDPELLEAARANPDKHGFEQVPQPPDPMDYLLDRRRPAKLPKAPRVVNQRTQDEATRTPKIEGAAEIKEPKVEPFEFEEWNDEGYAPHDESKQVDPWEDNAQDPFAGSSKDSGDRDDDWLNRVMEKLEDMADDIAEIKESVERMDEREDAKQAAKLGGLDDDAVRLNSK